MGEVNLLSSELRSTDLIINNLEQGSNMTRMENSREQVSSRELEHNMVEEWQTFSLEPRPELQGKTLSCHYVQVAPVMS